MSSSLLMGIKKDLKDIKDYIKRKRNKSYSLHYADRFRNINILSPSFRFSCDVKDSSITRMIENNWDSVEEWCWDRILLVYSKMYNTNTSTNVRHVSIKIFNFNGVGFTHDGEQPGFKVLNISSEYIRRVNPQSQMYELNGVICHELVHVFQNNGYGTVPSGFVEGIADFYRMRAGFPALHWKHCVPEKWDKGYEQTAFFFDWVEKNFPSSISRINEYLSNHRWYDEDPFKVMTGFKVKDLFDEYVRVTKRDQ